MTPRRLVDREFLARDALDVAPDLLGKLLVVDGGAGRRVVRIVETEAYRGSDDPASHSFRGPTPRNAVMFSPPGRLYVYLSYGIHHCANVVCGDRDGHAVLLRAAAPLDGIDAMRRARGRAATRDRDLCSGPGKLAQALGLDRSFDGVDLLESSTCWLEDDDCHPSELVQTTRVGISRAADEPWRWYVADDANVSRR